MKKLLGILSSLICVAILCTAVPSFGYYDPYREYMLIADYASVSGHKSEDVIIECDYGSHSSGRVVILDIKGEENKDEPYDVYIGELCFRFSSEAYANRFLYYRWGVYERDFYTVKQAYEEGYLSSKDVYEIALLHGVDTYAPDEIKVDEDNCKWSFDPVTGKVKVEGDMPDYRIINGKSTSPSSKWRYDIKELETEYGLSVGDHAFYNCENLERVELYQNLRIIGKGAFEGCGSITEFVFPEGIRQVSEDAFKDCDKLEKMTFYGKAPKLYPTLAKDFQGEISYPAESPFWTDAVRNGYSQTAKWTAFDAPEIKEVENYFDDLSPRGWYLSGIQYCCDRGIMEGVGNCLFEPNAPLTREQVAMVMYQYLEADETYTSYSFKDVKAGTWYADAVEWMYQSGYTKGVSADKYGVGRYVTRQDLVTLVYNTIFREYDLAGEYWCGEYHCKGGISSFSDVGSISDYAYNAMRFAVEVNDSSMCRGPGEITPILYGDNKKMLRPKDICTRAEAAAIFQRAMWTDYFSPVSKVTPPSS